jgi:hypothetical protein
MDQSQKMIGKRFYFEILGESAWHLNAQFYLTAEVAGR